MEQGVILASAEERQKPVIELHDVGVLEETFLVLLIAVLRVESKPGSKRLHRRGAQRGA